MKKITEMTDQELNEWIAINVMRWQKDILFNNWVISCPGMDLYSLERVNFGYDPESSGNFFNPSEDLNHTYLMEERIFQKRANFLFYDNLIKLIKDACEIELGTNTLASLASHATARQRCEAAYLTFMQQ